MRKLLAATVLSVFAMAATAQAVEYSEADANGDGLVTVDEAKAAMPDASEEIIVAADANGDGVISEAEFEALAGQ